MFFVGSTAGERALDARRPSGGNLKSHPVVGGIALTPRYSPRPRLDNARPPAAPPAPEETDQEDPSEPQALVDARGQNSWQPPAKQNNSLEPENLFDRRASVVIPSDGKPSNSKAVDSQEEKKYFSVLEATKNLLESDVNLRNRSLDAWKPSAAPPAQIESSTPHKFVDKKSLDNWQSSTFSPSPETFSHSKVSVSERAHHSIAPPVPDETININHLLESEAFVITRNRIVEQNASLTETMNNKTNLLEPITLPDKEGGDNWRYTGSPISNELPKTTASVDSRDPISWNVTKVNAREAGPT